jgi:hypothetical protein
MASYNLITEITDTLNNKTLVGGIFCNLKNSIDCVKHSILLTKLKFNHITDKVYTLIKPHLENRQRRVTLNDKCFNFCSSWGVTKRGVPQGFIPGRCFFFLFNIDDQPKIINDKDNNIKSKLILFTSDTSLIITNPNLTDFIIDIYTTIKNINE